jgi:hypothetical protein
MSLVYTRPPAGSTNRWAACLESLSVQNGIEIKIGDKPEVQT